VFVSGYAAMGRNPCKVNWDAISGQRMELVPYKKDKVIRTGFQGE